MLYGESNYSKVEHSGNLQLIPEKCTSICPCMSVTDSQSMVKITVEKYILIFLKKRGRTSRAAAIGTMLNRFSHSVKIIKVDGYEINIFQ